MYIEPGGYYEQNLEFKKPVIACVVGRWKAKLTRAVGHAGAMGGSGDSAEAKEGWFMKSAQRRRHLHAGNPIVSQAGAVVTNISHIPAALTAVMRLNGVEPDFAPVGDLTLKPGSAATRACRCRRNSTFRWSSRSQPYRDQIAELSKQIGAMFPREPMKDRSGSSIMDAKTQVTRVSGVSILDTAKYPLESNYCLALIREHNDANDNALFNTAIASCVVYNSGPVRTRPRPCARPATPPIPCWRRPARSLDRRRWRAPPRPWTR